MVVELKLSEYARHRGASRTAATKWKRKGYLVFTENGLVDRDASDARLDSRGPPKNGAARSGASVPESPEQSSIPPKQPELSPTSEPTHQLEAAGADIRALADNLNLLSTHEAEQVKANYLALQRWLEYEREAGELVPVDQAAQAVAAEYATVRSHLMTLATELAPEIAQQTGGDANTIREVLMAGVTRKLEGLLEEDPFGVDGNAHDVSEGARESSAAPA